MSIIVGGQVVPTPAQLALDIELFYSHLETLDRSDLKSQGVCRSEAMQRADLYKRCMKNQYRRIPEIRTQEKQFLVDFFSVMRGHNWKVKFGWAGQKKTISKPELKVLAANGSQFYGVEANQHLVQGIDLSGNGCKGIIPATIASINDCKFLKLNWNRIHGPIPRSLSKLTQLEELHLFGNNLQGSLDFQTMEALSNLRSLNLSFNQLTGPLPDAFQQSHHLREINLAGNKFSGELPPSMQNLENLEILKLYNNEFSGDIPEWFDKLASLSDVNLSQNKFGGTLHPFMKCTKLRHLVVCHNRISGSLGTDLTQLPDLQLLYASYNRLSGPVPASICLLGKLSKLNLSNNELSGTLPAAFGNLENLEICILGYNLIRGPAPLSMSNLKNLKDFELFTTAPSETLYVPRAFEAHAFQRIYGWGASVHLDNVHWVEEGDESKLSLIEPNTAGVALSIDVISNNAAGNEEASEKQVFSPSISRWLVEKESK